MGLLNLGKGSHPIWFDNRPRFHFSAGRLFDLTEHRMSAQPSRRLFLAFAGAGVGSFSLPAGAAPAQQASAAVERSTTRVRGLQSPEMDFQLMRSLGAGNYGGGTPGEIFQRLGTIDGNVPAQWPPAFGALAREVEAKAEKAARNGHAVSARDHYSRASMYWRAAEYFSDPFGPDMRERGLASRSAFLAATKGIRDKIEPIDIPFEGMKLPGYLMTPAVKPNGRTILILTGFDGTGEELYFETARAGLERGFTVFVGQGPGQIGTLRFYPKSVFRPDYEKPISAMIDVALSRPEVDPRKLALYGISLGGYFATRGAEHDQRIKAVILNSPVVDLRAYMMGFVGGEEGAAKLPPLKLSEVDSVPDNEMYPTQKLLFKDACQRFGVDSLAGWFERLKAFNAVDRLAQIKCPSLAMVGAGEGPEALAQMETFAARASGPVTRRVFEVAEGADMHCQLGNLPLSNAVLYDWLAEVL
jgi:alpha-beta hydrolase superfamily lysophospholipase